MESGTTRIFLIDDHPAVLDGLRLRLDGRSCAVCGEAGSAEEALQSPDLADADLILLDLSLGETSGLDLLDALFQKHSIPVVVYSMHEDAQTIEDAFRRGARGYVSKREMATILFDAITTVAAGHRYLSPRATLALKDRPPLPERQVPLSEREREILALLGAGETQKDIAGRLEIGVRTVETHFTRIMNKLGLDGMKELRRYATRNSKS